MGVQKRIVAANEGEGVGIQEKDKSELKQGEEVGSHDKRRVRERERSGMEWKAKMEMDVK